MKDNVSRRGQSTIKSVAKIVMNFGACIAIIWYGVFIGVDNVSDAMNDRRLSKEGHSTRGVITEVDFDLQYGRGAESSKIFEIDYSDNSDKSYTHVAKRPYRTAEEPGQQEVREQFLGQRVTVLYDPANPSDAVVEGWEASISLAYVGSAVVILFGAIFLFFGISDTKTFRKNFKKLKY